MIKKIFYNISIILFFIVITFILIFSSIGIKTDKLNKIIIDKVEDSQNINLQLDKIKFKLDPKQLSLFVETQRPKINYSNIEIPAQNIKVYIEFIPLLKTKLKIKKLNVDLEELNISELKKLSSIIKPSNFRSFINNKVKEGKIKTELEIFLNNEGSIKSYIAKGSVENLNTTILKNFSLIKTNFSFFLDNEDILIKRINGKLEDFEISNGDLRLNLDNGIKLNSNFDSSINLDDENFVKYKELFKKHNLKYNIKYLNGKFNNNLYIEFDNTYRAVDYNHKLFGKLEKGNLELSSIIKNNFITDEIKEIYFSDFNIKSTISPKNLEISGEGKYSFNNYDFLKLTLVNSLKDNLSNLKINLDYKNDLNLDLINYKKSDNSVANLSLNLEKNNDLIKIKEFSFNENNNVIRINDLIFKKNIFSSFNKIKINTVNNNFNILGGEKILIKGKKFDATYLPKFLNNLGGENKFKKLNSKIEIDFENVKVPMSEKLENFKLIGEIQKGEFVKISSKGDFGGNNYLDISMKREKINNSKYLEVYSDLTRPLLTEYGFFSGLSGGKLFFTSLINDHKSISKLKIENFKVINAPGVIKLLSLADLGGLEDLAKGEGLSFDVLEINFEKNKNSFKFNEILALGPSMSVLMDGYKDEDGVTSIRGTLVPAKTLNKLISKIPVIGNIVIPKEVGEGLFGISFKMKGPKGDIKTTINPIRTLTPRFLQKIVERNKASN